MAPPCPRPGRPHRPRRPFRTPPAPAPAAGTDAGKVRSVLLEVVADKTGYPADMLDLTMNVEADLGIDSIKRVEIMGVIQERFHTTTTAGPEQLAELRTLGDIVDFVAGGAASSAPAAAPATGPDAGTVRSVLLEVVADKTGYPADMLDLTMNVEADLGIDSIKRVEIMGVIQERFHTTTTAGPEQLAELRTLGDIVDFVAGTTAQATAPAATGPDADTVRTTLLEVVADKTGYPADMLDLTMNVEADLGIDSIKRVEIMGVIQERFHTTTTAGPEQLAELRTLGDIVDFVAGAGVPRAAGREAASAGAPEDHPPEPESDRPARIGRAQAALVELPASDPLLDAYHPDHGALVVDDGSQLAARLVERLTGTGRRVHTLRLPGVPARSNDVHDHALTGWGTTELAAQTEEIFADRIALVVDVTAQPRAEWAEGTRRLAHSLLLARHVVAPLSAAAEHGRAAFLTATVLDGAFGLTGVAEELAPAGGVAGLVKTLALEAPALFCRAVDLDPALDAATGAALLLDEAADSAPEPVQVGLDGTRRVGLTLAERPLTEELPEVGAPTSDDLLVVTGEARGITATCLLELAERHRPGLLLLGRTRSTRSPTGRTAFPTPG
ncbi:hypothetical protein SHKM778_25810 [Streptomyces sp. KM77-8]|uniref:Carrier domain-containing protein n=1 Tax=Streptomyces haneummycinicus TaxID=3074435 RepID=A0AAT9HFY8_9ACTN